MTLTAGDPRHGTVNGYGNHGCRCDACRKAATDYLRDLRHRLGHHRPREQYLAELRERPAPPHGTESRYARGCRCEHCRHAASEARKRRRHADLEAANAYDRAQKRRWRAARRG